MSEKGNPGSHNFEPDSSQNNHPILESPNSISSKQSTTLADAPAKSSNKHYFSF